MNLVVKLASFHRPARCFQDVPLYLPVLVFACAQCTYNSSVEDPIFCQDPEAALVVLNK